MPEPTADPAEPTVDADAPTADPAEPTADAPTAGAPTANVIEAAQRPEWWQTYFTSPAWQKVQLSWDSVEGERSGEQADRIVEAARLQPGMHVLDAPCGAARIAIELVARGMSTTGLDVTEAFLDEGRRRAAQRGVEVDLIRGDLRDPDAVPAGAFDAVVCMWGSFGYFDDEGNRAQARAAARALRRGGRYLIDIPSTETLYRRFRGQREWFEVDEVVVLQDTQLNIGTGRAETTWTFLSNGGRDVRHSSIRIYSLHELTELLRSVGFTAFEARDDELEPFELGSQRLWMVATRDEV